MITYSDVTICIPTSWVPSCPSGRLVQHVYTQLVTQYSGFSKCPVVIGYDNYKGETAYYQELCNLSFASFVCDTRSSLLESIAYRRARSFKNMIDQVTTKYLLFWEHDWAFTFAVIDWDSLFSILDAESTVNTVYFNKRKNVLRGVDVTLQPRTWGSTTLCRTSRYSNNPSLTCTRTWRTRCSPVVAGIAQTGVELERVVYEAYRSDIKKKGFIAANEDWGAYLYGDLNSGPYVKHFNGAVWNGKI